MNSLDQSPTAKPQCASCELSRRNFLQLLGAGAGFVILGGCDNSDSSPEAPSGSTANPIVAVPTNSPTGKKTATAKAPGEFLVKGAGQLAVGKALVFSLPESASGEKQLGVVFMAETELRALSAKCTHAGCFVEWQEKAKELHCPCHGSRFDGAGKVLTGPATVPLPVFKVRPSGNDAIVTLP